MAKDDEFVARIPKLAVPAESWDSRQTKLLESILKVLTEINGKLPEPERK